MTDEEAYKLFDSILQKSILESLEALEEKRKNHSYAEKVISEIMQRNNIPYTPAPDEDVIEVSYSELERQVKRELRNHPDPWLDQEIKNLRKKLGE